MLICVHVSSFLYRTILFRNLFKSILHCPIKWSSKLFQNLRSLCAQLVIGRLTFELCFRKEAQSSVHHTCICAKKARIPHKHLFVGEVNSIWKYFLYGVADCDSPRYISLLYCTLISRGRLLFTYATWPLFGLFQWKGKIDFLLICSSKKSMEVKFHFLLVSILGYIL